MNQGSPKPAILLTDPIDIMIQGCRENDLQCQEQLYRFCYPDMIKICQRYAGDMDGAGIIFNNAMLRVFKNINNYIHDDKLKAWVKVIVINCCIDFVKKSNKIKEIRIGKAEEAIIMEETVLDRLTAKEIQAVMKELPKATAVVLNLYIYEGYTHKQIGESLGISEGTSKWHVNDGRRLLKAKLEHLLKPKLNSHATG